MALTRAFRETLVACAERNRRGQYSIRINDQWRICFAWKGVDVYDVEIVDYH